ncbi:MAG: SlyX family protein [Puniceicoccales bacterium]|jgi:uncharacterized coiled-coil protein SlyX|nr:SlyX family protein [Puniceicoccales bacterium]
MPALPSDALAERVLELEIKVTFLEKHVEEQDRAMLAHFRQIDELRREIQRLATAQQDSRPNDTPFIDNQSRENEKPPHY